MMATMAPPSRRAESWLVELYRAHRRDLVRLATLLVDDQAIAEDAVQDAFVAMARQGGRDIEDPGAYLRTAVLNNARSTLRKRRVRRRHLRSVDRLPVAPGADQAVLLDEDARQVLAALRELSDRQREVLVLRYWADLSEAEIADALGISAGSVKTHAHRGTAALARILEAP
jgi:RNA polymerase sigma-70 factor (sigma-E family)